jgi:hypothetical protein
MVVVVVVNVCMMVPECMNGFMVIESSDEMRE